MLGNHFVIYLDPRGAGRLIVGSDGRIKGLQKGRFGPGVLEQRADGTIVKITDGNETELGKPGDTFEPAVLSELAKRFGGHKPGADPMIHAQIPKSGGHQWVDDPNPDQHDKYRLALWCEDPHVAYLALADAMYRPRVSLRVDRLRPTLHDLQLAIHLPYFIDGQSILHYRMEMEVNGRVVSTEAKEIHSFGSGKAGPMDNHNNWAVAENGLIKLTVKVRLDVFGDEKLCLPIEPFYSEDTVEKEPAETQGGKDHPGKQPKSDRKWIVAYIITKMDIPPRANDRYPKMI